MKQFHTKRIKKSADKDTSLWSVMLKKSYGLDAILRNWTVSDRLECRSIKLKKLLNERKESDHQGEVKNFISDYNDENSYSPSLFLAAPTK